MELFNIFLVINSIVTFFLISLIILSNSRSVVNRSLAFYLSSTLIWLLTNFLTNISQNQSLSLFFAKTTFLGAVLISYSFLLFCVAFTKNSLTKGEITKYGMVPFLLLLLTPTSANIQSIEAYGRNTQTGYGYILLVLLLVAYSGAGFLHLYKYYSLSITTKTQKKQVKYIVYGGVLTLVPGIIANAILPLFGYTDSVFYGPNSIIILSIFTTLAIIKHKLLDIKLIVVRSLAYVLSLLFFGALSLVAINLLVELFDSTSVSESAQRILFITIAMVLAIFFQPLKKIFDQTTKKIFYRDAYDTQELINAFNQVIVSTIDLERLLLDASDVIEEHIKPIKVSFAIRQGEADTLRLISKFEDAPTKELSEQLRAYMHIFEDKVIVTSSLGSNEQELKLLLQEADISVLARVTTTVETEGIGYLALGPKKSGSAYNLQDVNAIELLVNELVIAIQNALQFEEIQRFNLTLQEKIDSATKELQNSNEKLRQLDEAKDEFISMASHQLRTPLTSIKGYLSMVLEGDAGKVPAKQRDMLSSAFTSSQRMVYLIADLLNVSRLKTGKFIIEKTDVDLPEVVQGEVDQLEETAKNRRLKIIYKKPKTFPKVMLDETKIRQVIMNFLDNAIYYTPAGGEINVVLEHDATSVSYKVIDNGIGVPKSEQHKLFQKFYRAGNAKKARPDGTGLGIFMAQKIIVAQEGSIIFSSEEGKGSTFGFSFPREKIEASNSTSDGEESEESKKSSSPKNKSEKKK